MTLGRLGLALVVVAPAMLAGCADLAQQAAEAAIDAAGCVDASAAQAQGTMFQYAGAVSCKDAEETHTWNNPSPYAEVQWTGAVAEGSLHVRILDGAGREVKRFDLTAVSAEGAQGRTELGFPTLPPAVGAWTVHMRFVGFTGGMGLQVSAAMPPGEARDALPAPVLGAR